MVTEGFCTCPAANCAPHRICGDLCSACADGEHRKEGEIGTAAFREELVDTLRASIERSLLRPRRERVQ